MADSYVDRMGSKPTSAACSHPPAPAEADFLLGFGSLLSTHTACLLAEGTTSFQTVERPAGIPGPMACMADGPTPTGHSFPASPGYEPDHFYLPASVFLLSHVLPPHLVHTPHPF